MKIWKMTKVLDAPIEGVWKAIINNLRVYEHLDCDMIFSEELTKTKDLVGSKYLQIYKIGKKEVDYRITITDYHTSRDEKKIELTFSAKEAPKVLLTYKLKRVTDMTTGLSYKVENISSVKKDDIFKYIVYSDDNEIRNYFHQIEESAKKIDDF